MKLRINQGFTLIEMIGVMAILAILAATIAPSILKDIDRSVAETEQQNLAALAKELEIYIQETKIIPSRTEWDAALATVSSRPLNKINQNARFFNRRYYVDPRFFSNTDTNFAQYTQTSGNTTSPVSPRIILASNLKGNLPANLTNSTTFNAVWDQTLGATIVEGPDIVLERINLKGLFHRVILGNDNTTDQPAYQLENNALTSIPSGGLEFFVLSNTKINLYEAPFTNNVIEKVLIADNSKNLNYQFNGSNWLWDKL